MEGEWQPLELVIILITQIIGHPVAQPLAVVALAEAEEGAHNRHRQDQPGAGPEGAGPARLQAGVNRLLQNLGDENIQQHHNHS
jgi:hypothetical protein